MSQHTKLTLEKKFLPSLLPGLELATFQSQFRRSTSKLSWGCSGRVMVKVLVTSGTIIMSEMGKESNCRGYISSVTVAMILTLSYFGTSADNLPGFHFKRMLLWQFLVVSEEAEERRG